MTGPYLIESPTGLRSLNSGLLVPMGSVDPDPDPPASWLAALESRDLAQIAAWYDANTGHAALGLSASDLTPGSIISDYDGQVFEGISSGIIRIRHNNVTVRGCRVVNGGATYGYDTTPAHGSTHTGTLVEHTTFFGGDPPIDAAAVLASSSATAGMAATFRNCDMRGWSSGVLAHGGVNVEYCYTRDFYGSGPAQHVSSFNASGSNIRFHRNFATEGGSPLVSIYFDTARAVHNVEITENILDGTLGNNWPSYALFGKVGQHEATATGIVVGGNHIGGGFQYGQRAGMGSVRWGQDGNVQTPNFDLFTGEPV